MLIAAGESLHQADSTRKLGWREMEAVKDLYAEWVDRFSV